MLFFHEYKQGIMEVYKFGGASVKDANGLRNVVRILRTMNYDTLVIVVSAMGKTTNALEKVVEDYFDCKSEHLDVLANLRSNHLEILEELHLKEEASVQKKLQTYFMQLDEFLTTRPNQDYDYVYDQVVSFGELLSSTLLHAVLEDSGIPTTWVDSRKVLKTNADHRRAAVNWEETEALMKLQFTGDRNPRVYLTQGFIGGYNSNISTTLGREGSDYSAAIIAHCLDANQVTIWKDVPGVLSADPRFFEHTQLLQRISYQEAIELTFYGATVIHPKTLQPLQRKKIPLYVKSFSNPESAGTCINDDEGVYPRVPCHILKRNEILLQLAARDFSFMNEEHLSMIFKNISDFKLKTDLVQNSAMRVSLCLDDPFNHLDALIEELKSTFTVEVTRLLSLYTIRFYTEESIAQIEENHKVLLKQVGENMAQLVVA